MNGVTVDLVEDALLEQLQRSAYDYSLQAYKPHTGLMADG